MSSSAVRVQYETYTCHTCKGWIYPDTRDEARETRRLRPWDPRSGACRCKRVPASKPFWAQALIRKAQGVLVRLDERLDRWVQERTNKDG
jgi:hypothetical protein